RWPRSTVDRADRPGNCDSLFARRAVAEVVERGHAVGLGPQPHRARTGDMAVLEVDVPRAVERNTDALARELDAQRMPCVGRHRRLDILERVALALARVVEGDVVPERVRARDVVVVAVLPAPDHAARLVLAPGDGLELHLDEAIGERRVFPHAPGERAAARLLEDMGRARRLGIGDDRPLGRPSPGDARDPAGGQCADFLPIETARICHGRSSHVFCIFSLLPMAFIPEWPLFMYFASKPASRSLMAVLQPTWKP